MPAAIASIICTVGILGLFYLDRDKNTTTSWALWIPAVWLFVMSSRPISFWLGVAPNVNAIDATQAYVEGSPLDRNVLAVLLLAAVGVLLARRHRLLPMARTSIV